MVKTIKTSEPTLVEEVEKIIRDIKPVSDVSVSRGGHGLEYVHINGFLFSGGLEALVRKYVVYQHSDNGLCVYKK